MGGNSTDPNQEAAPQQNQPQNHPAGTGQVEEILRFSAAARAAAQAATRAEVFTSVLAALEPTGYAALILESAGGEMRLSCTAGLKDTASQLPAHMPIDPEALGPLLHSPTPLLLDEFKPAHGQPQALAGLDALLDLQVQMGCRSAICLPLQGLSDPPALMVLGSPRTALSPFTRQAAADLAAGISGALQKLEIQLEKEQIESGMEILDVIGAALSGEISLQGLFTIIHEQVNLAMGEVNLYLALYDEDSGQVEIPYMTEDGQRLHVEPFPLGEGLTSVIIHTRRPLMLVDDVAAQARALGAKDTGRMARSWLGVPLLLGGQAFGALVVQDMEREKRFNPDDQRLLARIAGQAANAVRNAYLLENVRRQAERERQLFAITSKIRRSTDMETILRTTAVELGQALHLRRVHIEVRGQVPPPTQQGKKDERQDG